MRVVTLAPGVVFVVYIHQDRPTVEYVLKGSATEYLGETSKVYGKATPSSPTRTRRTGGEMTAWNLRYSSPLTYSIRQSMQLARHPSGKFGHLSLS